MVRCGLRTVLLLLIAAAAVSAGEITGRLAPPGRVSSVSAVDRVTKKTFTASYSRKTGDYRFRNLPSGTYDLILETKAGRIEGVNLIVAESLPKAKPDVLKPSELDKGEIRNIAAYLGKDAAGTLVGR